MRFAAIHQFHSGATSGDAITQQMFVLQRTLRSLGYVSDIYAEHIAKELTGSIRPISEFSDAPATLLFVHHSMGYSAFSLIQALTTPKVTIFHSITPARFFDDPWLKSMISLGYEQLRELARLSSAAIADSNHNRREMLDAGFASARVLPVRTDFSEFRHASSAHGSTHDWLFVGRVVPNKNQLAIVRAFAEYHARFAGGHLHLVGDLGFAPYVESVRQLIDDLAIGEHVTLHGKVTTTELHHRYATAGALVSLSQHEGFGVPLLEAMSAGVPVIALDTSAVAETMGGAGLLIGSDDPTTVAASAYLVLADTDVRRATIEAQHRRVAFVEAFDTARLLSDVIASVERGGTHSTSIQIQGPFETSYSLANLNRELATHLDAAGRNVSILATEGPGDYVPSDTNLASVPHATSLYRRGLTDPYPDVAIRQMYPPRVDDSLAALTLQYFGWEESGIPGNVVSDFNRHLDGIGTMSRYVKNILIDAGVTVPIEVMGVGVNPPDATVEPFDLPSEHRGSHVFLHISSAFPRKGVDVLLRAFFEEFSSTDPVVLILKTFANPHNDVGDQLSELRQEFVEPPAVIWVNNDMDPLELAALYAAADTYVHAARGEGFGLPVAEAMLAGVPVISTQAGGLADFVDPETADVVDTRPEPARTHLTVGPSLWHEPNRSQLRSALRRASDPDDSERRLERAENAHRLIETTFSWEAVAGRWSEFIDDRLAERRGVDVALVSSFNTRCGIAEYSAELGRTIGSWLHTDVLADRTTSPVEPSLEANVSRVWDNSRSAVADDLLLALADSDADITHVQYNFGFFNFDELARIVDSESARRPTVLTLHRTAPLEIDGKVESLASISESLNRAAAILVHQADDETFLRQINIDAPIHTIPIGISGDRMIDRGEARKRRGVADHDLVVATYGFLLPHKGVQHLLSAARILESRGIDIGVVICCALHPDPSSAAMLANIEHEIAIHGMERHVYLETGYLPDSDSGDWLSSADIIALPYEETAESSSAAIRTVLPIGRPIVATDLGIFRDVRDCIATIPSPPQPADLADEIERIWVFEQEALALVDAMEQQRQRTSWENTARQTRQIYARLATQARSAARHS